MNYNPMSHLVFFRTAFVLYLLSACGTSSDSDGQGASGADASIATLDAAPLFPSDAGLPDAGPCTPGADSLICKDGSTVRFCSEDTDFDGMSDSPPTVVEVACTAFFSDAGDASCETFDDTSTEALCTMDDGGPCGVILISGGFTSARCTTDDAACLLSLEAQNYVCTPGTGISCSATGSDFVPYCDGDKLVWRCTDDGDGTPQPHVDDCAALGSGTCNASDTTCSGIELGGQCNLTEWLCGDELSCENNVCVVK